MSSLEGKIILVTGAAKRIGRSIALRLADEGARVAIHYGTSEDAAKATARECGNTPIFQANLESVPDIQRMFAEVKTRLGGLDGLVNNAARFTRFDPLEITEADWDYIHSVNLKSVFFCCQSAARLMNQGRIVNISSLGGVRPWADHVHYCASKAGLIMMTKALAKAWAPRIAVNSVAPGVILFDPPIPSQQSMIDATPARRSGTGEEIADAVTYFMKAPEFITGQIMAVDGGLSLR